MKKPLLTILLTLLTCSLAGQSGGSWLQRTVSISVRDKTVAEVLKELENDLEGLVFAYSPGSFDIHRKVSVKMDSVSLEEVLQAVFTDQSLECAEMRGKIFLKKKKKQNLDEARKPTPVRRRRTVPRTSDKVKDSVAVERGSATGSEAEKQANQTGTPQSHSQTESKTSTQTQSKEENESTNMGIQNGLGGALNQGNIGLQSSDSAVVEELSLLLSPSAQTSIRSEMVISPLTLNASVNSLPEFRRQDFIWPQLPPVPFDSSQVKEPFLYRIGLLKPKDITPRPRVKRVKPADEPDEKKFKIYGASTTAITSMGADAGIKMGGRAVWLKTQNFGFGIAGYAVQRASIEDLILIGRHRLAGGYGGLHFEYNVDPNRFLHLSFPVMIGAGGIAYSNLVTSIPGTNRVNVDRKALFALEPGVSLEMNLIKFLKLGFDVTYRYTTNSRLAYDGGTGDEIFGRTELQGFSAGVTVKFGVF